MKNYNYHGNHDLSKCKFLITGGAGFIGSNLVEYLIRNNARLVRVLDNLSTGNFLNIEKFINHTNFEFINGDIRDFETCINAVNEIDYVSHQAALGSVPRSIKSPLDTNEVNITGFLNMLNASKETETIKNFVYASSSSVYGDSIELPKVEERIGDPISPYALTKLVNEKYASVFFKVYGFKSVGLRYFNVFGPNQSPENPYAAVIPLFIKAAIHNLPAKINGDGSTTRDFTYVENVVQANIKSMLLSEKYDKNMYFNIAYGKSTSLLSLWNIICENLKIEIKPSLLPFRVGDIKDSLANIESAKKILNYNPVINLEDGIKETIKSIKKP